MKHQQELALPYMRNERLFRERHSLNKLNNIVQTLTEDISKSETGSSPLLNEAVVSQSQLTASIRVSKPQLVKDPILLPCGTPAHRPGFLTPRFL